VCAHGKGLLVTLPCAHARQRGHVALTCAPGSPWRRACRGLCRAALHAGARQRVWHGTARTHGKECAHGKEQAARQRMRARQTQARTAKATCTAKRLPHGKGRCRANSRRARQWCRCCRYLCRAVFAVRPRTATPLRANKVLYRAKWRTAMAVFPVVWPPGDG
jgi:hypothetical protein